ncbi:MAG: amphi-Trp domain-containing protein [Gaiella sp.]
MSAHEDTLLDGVDDDVDEDVDDDELGSDRDDDDRLQVALEEEIHRGEAATRLRALADALDAGGRVRVDGWDGELVLRVPELVTYELEAEHAADGGELEVELRWGS